MMLDKSGMHNIAKNRRRSSRRQIAIVERLHDIYQPFRLGAVLESERGLFGDEARLRECRKSHFAQHDGDTKAGAGSAKARSANRSDKRDRSNMLTFGGEEWWDVDSKWHAVGLGILFK